MKLALSIAWALFAISVVALVSQIGPWGLTLLFGEGALLTIGTLLVVRRTGMTFGTTLVFIGLAWAIVLATNSTVETLAARGDQTVSSWLALGVMITSIPLLWITNIVIWLIFPEGRPSTARGRSFLRISAAYTAALALAHVFARPRFGSPDEPEYPHPFLDQAAADGVGAVVDVLVVLLLFMGGFVAAGMLFARARRSGVVERRQIALVAFGYVVSNVILLVNGFARPLGDAKETDAGIVLDSLAFFVIAVTLGVAIMKYRLYDIDIIISKSVMYLGLVVAITAVYAALVVGPLLVVGASDSGDGPGLLLPIIATGVVAVLFEPIRSRMQHWANRLVYGKRSTPHEVLSEITAQLADTQGQNTDDLARLIAQGTGADHAVVWLDGGGELRAAGHCSIDDALPTLPAADDEFSAMHDVYHEGERLGAVSIVKPRNDPMTPADRELLDDIAAGAGLLLRNIGLNRELENRADEVRESRRRLIEAQDRERHRLERDLHDGAQQRVVALKVKLGIAKTVARREGADEIMQRIIGLADDAQVAVDALRAVAHGIYPPLLESGGLGSAMQAVGRTSALSIELDAADLERYERSTEETAFFCVTETLERARMSGATSARVEIAGRNGDLVTEIDLGVVDTEVDLRAVSDRLDAAGGTLTIEDQPTRGLCIVSSLPLAHIEGAKS